MRKLLFLMVLALGTMSGCSCGGDEYLTAPASDGTANEPN